MARVHRVGQTQQVIAYKIVVRDSIEEKILRLRERKQNLVATFMEGGEGEEENLLQALSPEDLDHLMA